MSVRRCDVCPRGCRLAPGKEGACHARANVDGSIVATSYGRITSLAIDPVEKKPLACWRPGSKVLSLGGYGCNLRCPWCQNSSISQVGAKDVPWHHLAPSELVSLGVREREKDERMVGIAYTYNEPLVSWEYICDTAELAHGEGLANVLVTAGCVSEHVVRKVAPLMDAVNIDLKSIDGDTYKSIGGDLEAVKTSIRVFAAVPSCHVEVTTLVVPGVNDTPDHMERLAAWVAQVDPSIVLHVSRFFPAWRMRDRGPTPVSTVYALADVARGHLGKVYTGNC